MDLPHLLILQVAILAVFVSCKGIFPGAESVTLSLVTDKEALISFKSLLSLEPTNPLSSWDQNSSPCNWTGVICNKPGERVVGLDLSGLGIMGSISPHVGNLSFLRSLQLQDNQLTGMLPDQLGNLFRLKVLNMSSNRIEGAIPPNISLCKELLVLDMMQNEISGGIPEELSHLTKLQVLHLGKNHLSGAIPPSIANISSLIHLNLGTNHLGGMIPSDLARLRNLKQLDLTINNISGTVPPSIYNMSSLAYLALASNNLWGNLPGDVGVTLPNLLSFNFCFNKFTGTIPGSLHNLTNIQIIRMAHNLLHGTVPPGLGNLPDLQMYNIGFNYITSSGDSGLNFLTSLTNSTRLNFLAIDGNLLEGVIPESIGNLSKRLTHLYMGGNRIDEYGMGGRPSTAGDVYSYGIMLLELFTGKKPTNESFMGGLSLKKWVQMAFPANVEQVLDPELLSLTDELSQDDQFVSPETQSDCLITIIGVGLSCTADSPGERISMSDVLHKLKSVRDALIQPTLLKRVKN
ncbi:hypothetical protein F0562_027605 [Nyssa sinensis]|uniref:Uncharacterized protein n=1 Tax=Nyssa sinensis TaxID=561372 RepID=A0A5J5B3C6_9ASTE|nr:hypothetical protein F0562_027605 [Nyssa sinensis]